MKNKYLKLKNQIGGKIKIRTRTELIQFLIDNRSLTTAEASKLERQLKIIDEYINGKVEVREEYILSQVAKIALQVFKTRKILPRDNQLIAVLLFLQGKNTLLQAGTGQGKSLIVAMVAILYHNLLKCAVHIITTNDDLVTSAISDNKALFKACNVRVRTVNEDGYSNDVIYGKPFDFEALALNEASNPKLPRKLLDSKVSRVVILDESDSHLVDNANGRVLTSDIDPLANSVKDVLKKIAEQVVDFNSRFSKKFTKLEGITVIKDIINDWVKINHPEYLERWNSEKDFLVKNAFEVFSPSSYRDGVSFVLQKSLFIEIEDLKRDYPKLNLSSVVDSLESFWKKIPNEAISLKNLKISLKKWSFDMKKIESAFSFESKSRYNRIFELIEEINSKNAEETRALIFTGAIQYLDVGTGQIINNMKFSDGIQEFLELKYFKQIFTEPTISVRSYSLYRYLRESQLILGLSGTVGLDVETVKFQRKVWQIERVPIVLPEFAVTQLRNSKPLIHKDNQEDWFHAIYNEINEYSIEQPILIITENPEQAHQVQNNLMKRSLKPSIYEASTDKHILQEKLGPGRIIITTNLGGRGSDYQYDSVKAPKGLHVIIVFDSDEERILAQARGRAGRAGNLGSWQQISFGPKLQQKPKLENIKNSVKKTIGEDAIFEIYLFIKKLIEKVPSITQSKKNLRLNYLMSWLSNPTVHNNLIDKLTTKYKERVDDILVLFILQTWIDFLYRIEGAPRHILQNNSETRELTNLLKPHLSELYRLNL